MSSQFVVAAASALIAVVLGVLYTFVTEVKSKGGVTAPPMWIVVVKNGLVGGVLVYIATTVLLLSLSLDSLQSMQSKIMQPNALAQLNDLVYKSSSDEPMLSSIKDKQRELEEEIGSLVQGRIPLRDDDEVVEAWRRSVEDAQTCVKAINYVNPSFWLAGSEFSRKQLSVQSAARERGVMIRRIFIFDGHSPDELAALSRLAKEQRGIGIDVRFIPCSRVLSSTVYNKYKLELNGALDLVIYDVNVALLTSVGVDRRIGGGTLTKERPIVDAANELFEKLWAVADKSPSSSAGGGG